MPEVWIEPRFDGTEFIDGYFSHVEETKEQMPTPEEQAAAAAKAQADADAAAKLVADAKAKAEAEQAAKNKSKESDHEGDEGKKSYDSAYVERLRREKAEAEREAKALKDEKEEAAAKKLAEDKEFRKLADMEREKREKLEATHAEELTKRDRRAIQAEIRAEARAQGIIDSDLAALADSSACTVDSDGNIVGVEAAITALKTTKPHLFKTEDSSDKEKPRRTAAQPGSKESSKPKYGDAYDMSKEDFDRQYETFGRV